MKKFHIDPEFLTSVLDNTYRSDYIRDLPKEEQCEQLLKHGNNIVRQGIKDHPEFAELREQLGRDGYIRIERSWWNGDLVLKEFSLNGYTFNKGTSFLSACALNITFKIADIEQNE